MMIFAILQSILTHHLGYEIGNILRVFDIPVVEGMLKHWYTAEYSTTKPRLSKQKKRRLTFAEKDGQQPYKRTKFGEAAHNAKYSAGGFNE